MASLGQWQVVYSTSYYNLKFPVDSLSLTFLGYRIKALLIPACEHEVATFGSKQPRSFSPNSRARTWDLHRQSCKWCAAVKYCAPTKILLIFLSI